MQHRLLFPLLAIVGIFLFLANTETAKANTFESVDLYQSFQEMTAWAAALEAANPDIVKLVEFGQSHQGQPLLALKLSTTPEQNDPNKPEFLFTGGVHAREVIGSEACYRLAEHLVNSYNAGSAAAIDILNEREVWIVPTLNPDGRIHVENGYSKQRKNMEYFEGQSTNPNFCQFGVDLNRNFPHRWGDAGTIIRAEIFETYRGPSPLSTPEASALWWDLLKDEAYFSDMLAAVDFHSGVRTILTPWISSGEIPTEDSEKFEFLANGMNNANMFSYPLNNLGYGAFGTLTDSLYEEFGAYALCLELFRGPSSDFFSIFNPITEIARNFYIEEALNSSMFLLSDDAFPIVPEPATWLLTLFAVAWLVSLRRRPR